MFRARCFVAFFLLVLSAALARADGLLYQVPKDGSWATYETDASAKGPKDMKLTMKGTVTLASVGQVTEEGQPCRWIEVHVKMAMNVGEHSSEKSEDYKLLIPEKYLAKGEVPLEHVLRAWMRRGHADPQRFSRANDIDAGPLPMFLAAPWKDVKQLGKADVESKLGKVACEGVQGTLEFKTKQDKVLKCKFENRLHPDSPFGVVASHWTIQLPEMPTGEGMKWNMKLTDLGVDAKSRMPDAK